MSRMFAARRVRWLVIALWLLTLAASAAASSGVADRLSGAGWELGGSDSQRAAEVLAAGFPERSGSSVALVVRDGRGVPGTVQFEDRVRRVVEGTAADPRLKVVSTAGWATAPAGARGAYVGADHRTTITTLELGIDSGTARRVLPALQHTLMDRFEDRGLDVFLLGEDAAHGEINVLSAAGLMRAELVALPLVLLLMLLLYRSVLAAAVSMAVGATAIVGTRGVIGVLSHHVHLSVFAQNAAVMIGLGVGVDYALFMIRRFGDELDGGDAVPAALATTLRTSGRTVLSSGLAVIAAVTPVFLIDVPAIRSMAFGAMVAVAFAMAAGLVVLPALLAVLGTRVRRLRRPGRGAPGRGGVSRWQSCTERVMRRPVPYLAASVAVLGALAAPAAGLRTFTPDVRVLPGSSPIRAGDDLVARQFGPGAVSPITVALTSPTPLGTGGDLRPLVDLGRRLEAVPGVARVDSPLPRAARAAPPGAVRAAPPPGARRDIGRYLSADRRTLLLSVVPGSSPSSDAAREIVRRARALADVPGWRAAVGGETAEGMDTAAGIMRGLPFVAAGMLLLVYLLLLVAFRSVLLPLKAILMSLLSVGAAYGVLVLVFQHGRGPGAHDPGYLQNFVPVLVLVLVFSLSTDYEVFLLDRVREEYLACGDNARAVALGVGRTAPLISGAAVLMVAVFGAFTLTGLLPVQQMGLGLGAAVALDATLVRLVVVPAAMRLMGRWNWWAPGWMAEKRPAKPPRSWSTADRPRGAGRAEGAGVRTAGDLADT